MLSIKEVETVESVDDIKSSCSVRGNRMPDFEVLDARIASALNRILQNTRFKKKVSLEEMKAHKEERFLPRKTDRSLDLRTLPGHWGPMILSRIMPIYFPLFFEMTIFRKIRFKVGRNLVVNDGNPA